MKQSFIFLVTILVMANMAIGQNKAKSEELRVTLDAVFLEDQKHRLKLREIKKQYGAKSDEVQAQWEIIHVKDSTNLLVVTSILEEHGWLGFKSVGRNANAAIFLVIQHADLKTQEKYLPLMREAVKSRNAIGRHLALLEDRVAVRNGKKQIYGSQISVDKNGERVLRPIIDPKNVDKRRKEVGLGKLKRYLKRFNMTWDVDKHIERCAKLDAEKPTPSSTE